MKLTAIQGNRYAIRVEPGDTIDIVFDPAGVNALSGDGNSKRAATVGSISLPDGSMALSFDAHGDWTYISKGPFLHHLIFCRDFGADYLEFHLDKYNLKLKRVNLAEILGVG